MDKKFAFGTFCACCSATTSFLFGAVCVFSYFKSGDIMWIPFAILGGFGSMVMYVNRK
jgi:hypothetical protein